MEVMDHVRMKRQEKLEKMIAAENMPMEFIRREKESCNNLDTGQLY